MSDLAPKPPKHGGDFLLYQTDDGRTRLQVEFQGETACSGMTNSVRTKASKSEADIARNDRSLEEIELVEGAAK